MSQGYWHWYQSTHWTHPLVDTLANCFIIPTAVKLIVPRKMVCHVLHLTIKRIWTLIIIPIVTVSVNFSAPSDYLEPSQWSSACCGFCLLFTLAQNSGVRNWEQTSSLTTEMTHSTFCKQSDQVDLQRLRDSPLESRHTYISVSLFKSPYMPTTAFHLQGNRRRQSPRLLYSFPSRHSAPSQSWPFNDFTSFLWKPRCMVGNWQIWSPAGELHYRSFDRACLDVFPLFACHCFAGRTEPLIQSTGDRVSTFRAISDPRIVNHNEQ